MKEGCFFHKDRLFFEDVKRALKKEDLVRCKLLPYLAMAVCSCRRNVPPLPGSEERVKYVIEHLNNNVETEIKTPELRVIIRCICSENRDALDNSHIKLLFVVYYALQNDYSLLIAQRRKRDAETPEEVQSEKHQLNDENVTDTAALDKAAAAASTKIHNDIPKPSSSDNDDKHNTKPMTYDEKRQLSLDINKLPESNFPRRISGYVCATCFIRLPSLNEWKEHRVKCELAKTVFECHHCNQTFVKKGALYKHVANVHSKDKMESEKTCTSESKTEESQLGNNPGDIMFAKPDTEDGRTSTKMVGPMPVVTTQATKTPIATISILDLHDSLDEERSTVHSKETPINNVKCDCWKSRGAEMKEVGVQANIEVFRESKSHQKIIRKTRKFQDGAENVEIVEEDIWTD